MPRSPDWSATVLRPRAKRPLKVRILREAGGLGDVLNCLPAYVWMWENFAREGLTERALEILSPIADRLHPRLGEPCELVVYGFGPYRRVWEMAGVPLVADTPSGEDHPTPPHIAARWRSQMWRNAPGRRERWVNPWEHYGEDPDEFALSVDLWCPFWLHETGEGKPTRSRLEQACDAAGMRQKEIVVTRLHPGPEARKWARQWLSTDGWSGASGREPLVLLFPLSQGPSRVWPVERWAEVARALWKRNGARVMVLADRPWKLAWWEEHAPEFRRVVGLDWEHLTALMEVADLSLSGDTGPWHLAASCATPAVGVFGMTSGEMLSRHFPFATAIQGTARRCLLQATDGGEPKPAPASASLTCCDSPCYHNPRFGFDRAACYDGGCVSLFSIEAEQVIEASESVLVDEKNIRALASAVP